MAGGIMSEPTPTYAVDKSGTNLNLNRHSEAVTADQLIAQLKKENHEREILIENMAAENDALHTQKRHLSRLIHQRNREDVGLRDEIQELKQQKIRAHFGHERDLVKLLKEIEDIKESRRAMSGDLKKAWRQLTALEDERDDLREQLASQRSAANNIEQQRHALALQVVDLSGKLVSAGLERDQLRALISERDQGIAVKNRTINEQADHIAEQAKEIDKWREDTVPVIAAQVDQIRDLKKEIERLKNPKITIGGVDIPVRLDPTLKPDEWHIRYPMASSFPPPDLLIGYFCRHCGGALRASALDGEPFCSHCGKDQQK
jgi:chromosome segregation ATPase